LYHYGLRKHKRYYGLESTDQFAPAQPFMFPLFLIVALSLPVLSEFDSPGQG
jgi:hypothetical protein